jgi:hypothetical protein
MDDSAFILVHLLPERAGGTGRRYGVSCAAINPSTWVYINQPDAGSKCWAVGPRGPIQGSISLNVVLKGGNRKALELKKKVSGERVLKGF